MSGRTIDCDVFVLGGGSAGLAAAITASRAGAKTLLLERHGALGGMATASLVHSVCGLYILSHNPDPVLAHAGFPAEFARRLISSGASLGPVRMGRLDVLPHSPPGFAAVCDNLVSESSGLSVQLHGECTGAQLKNGDVQKVEFSCRGVRFQVRAGAWIDASGDAALHEMAGIETHRANPGHLQRPAFIFALHGVLVSQLDDQGRIRLAASLASAVTDGSLSSGALGTQVRATHRGSEVYITLDLAADAQFDPTEPSQISKLEHEGRCLSMEIFSFLKRTQPAFKDAHLSAFPARIGIRESRRIRGRSTLTGQDVILGSDFADAVALGTWPMENREKHTGPRLRYPKDDRPTQIPLGTLHSADIPNLWAAGRCISCDHEAQAAIRVMGTCLSSGQAAGAAAAIQALDPDGGVPSASQVNALVARITRA